MSLSSESDKLGRFSSLSYNVIEEKCSDVAQKRRSTPANHVGKDLYDQTIIVSIKENDTFDSDDALRMSFPNIFVDYPLGEMQTTDTK